MKSKLFMMSIFAVGICISSSLDPEFTETQEQSEVRKILSLIYPGDLNNADIIKDAIEKGLINVNAKNYPMEGYTPLTWVMSLKLADSSIDIAKSLIKAGADINEKNPDGYTPLHIAVKSFNDKGLNLLLDEPEIKIDALDIYGDTPLSLAVWLYSSGEIVKVIFERAMHQNKKLQLDEKRFDFNAPEDLLEIIEKLIQAGADANMQVCKSIKSLTQGIIDHKDRTKIQRILKV